MEINKNVSLRELNTFGVAANTKYLSEISNLQDIEALFEWKSKNNLPALLLGGGSNLLFKNDFEGLVAKVCLMGKDIAEEDDEAVYVSAAGGENWHDFVRWTIDQGFAGLENLSLIPGCYVISKAVIAERQRKLPDPREIGNAGSFFKNPVMKVSDFESLKNDHEGLPGFPQSHNEEVKTSAGWLIDQCGWKGH
ncbi:UDP-N-acetylenolpyruvoylglucosamine reductase [Nymphon striatum]|nr:UDP-N-acetylenolpyruvoylglucosamine reductase [Nymphon striatum]